MFKRRLAGLVSMVFILVLTLTVTVLAAPESEALRGTPKIDAEMDELWEDARIMEANVVQPTSTIQNPATAKVRALWDDTYLYVYAEVTDSKLNKAAGQRAWEVDSIEFFLDENNGKTATYDGDDAQYRVDIENVRTVGAGGRLLKFTESAVKITETGYIVEAAIPFKTKIEADQVIGFDIQVNDDSGAGKREGIVGWSQTQETAFSTSSVFGNLKLSAKTPAKGQSVVKEEKPVEDTAKTEVKKEDNNASKETVAAAEPAAEAKTEKPKEEAKTEETKIEDAKTEEAKTEEATTTETSDTGTKAEEAAAPVEAANEAAGTEETTKTDSDSGKDEEKSGIPVAAWLIPTIIVIGGAVFVLVRKGVFIKK